MIKGTTPTHNFTLPFDTALIAKLRVSYGQGPREVIYKTESDCTISGNKISVKLTQEDTLKFSPTGSLKIQLNIKTADNNVIKSDIIETDVETALYKGVM